MPKTPRRLSMRPIVAALMLAPVLAACGSAVMSRKADADQQAKAAYARCEARRAAHQLPTHLAAVDCAAPTVEGAYKEAAYPFEDLLYVSIAVLVAAAIYYLVRRKKPGARSQKPE